MTKLNATRVIGIFALIGATTGCAGMRYTKMEAAGSHTASNHIYVVPTPTPGLAGPDTVRTSTPDGSTVFVCADGTSRDASKIAPGKPACL